MAHEAIINFLFNSEGAIREIDNFKSRFSQALDGLADTASNIGKIFGVGGGLASFFSIKDFMEHIKLIGDLNVAYSNLPIEKIGRFSNAMELLGASDEEVISSLTSIQKLTANVKATGQGWPGLLNVLIGSPTKANGQMKTSLEILEELDEGIRRYEEAGKKLDEGQINKLLEDLGFSGSAFTAMKRYLAQSAEERKKFEKRLDTLWTPSEEDVKLQRDFADSLNELRIRFRELGKVLLDLGLGKIINGITEAIKKFNEASPETQKAILGITASLILLKPGIKSLKGLKNLLSLGGGVLGPWILLGAVYLAIANNIGGSKDALDEWLKTYNDWVAKLEKDHPFLAEFAKQIGDLGQAILHPIDTLKEHWEAMTKAFRELMDMVPDFLWDKNKGNTEKGFKLVDKMLEFSGAQVVKVPPQAEDEKVNNSKSLVFNPIYNITVEGNMDEETAYKLGGYVNRLGLDSIARQAGGLNTGGYR